MWLVHRVQSLLEDRFPSTPPSGMYLNQPTRVEHDRSPATPTPSCKTPGSSFRVAAADMATSHLEHLSRLTTETPASIRKTSIVCTIGPSCNKVETIKEMIANGMNIARVNCSHGDTHFHRATIRAIKEAREAFPHNYVAIALDTKGPEIRTGPTKDHHPVRLVEKAEFLVAVDASQTKECEEGTLYVDYPKIVEQLEIGQDIFIDDGVICLRVRSKSSDGLQCEVITGGKLYPMKGVNLPSVRVQLPILSEKDRSDLHLGIEEGVDMIFASYIRDRAEVEEVREALAISPKKIFMIAKIENEDSLRNIDDIIDSADGIVIARGPLGVETPSAKVAIVQKMVVSKCNRACKPVIIATQMLESMTVHPRATRAECSDVANAVLDGADCVMLSAETAQGAHPVAAVATMDRICAEAEAAYYQNWLIQDLRRYKTKLSKLESIATAAATAVSCMHASAIVLVTTTGKSAQICAQLRPPVPIVALCASKRTARQLQLFRGVLPVYYHGTVDDSLEKMDAVEQVLKWGVELGKRRGFINSGDPVVLITRWPNDHLLTHSMMQLVWAQ